MFVHRADRKQLPPVLCREQFVGKDREEKKEDMSDRRETWTGSLIEESKRVSHPVMKSRLWYSTV